jgi:hypothetical protein
MILTWHFNFSRADTGKYDLTGWLWSDNFGWISLYHQKINVDIIKLEAISVDDDLKITVNGAVVYPTAANNSCGSQLDDKDIYEGRIYRDGVNTGEVCTVDPGDPDCKHVNTCTCHKAGWFSQSSSHLIDKVQYFFIGYDDQIEIKLADLGWSDMGFETITLTDKNTGRSYPIYGSQTYFTNSKCPSGCPFNLISHMSACPYTPRCEGCPHTLDDESYTWYHPEYAPNPPIWDINCQVHNACQEIPQFYPIPVVATNGEHQGDQLYTFTLNDLGLVDENGGSGGDYGAVLDGENLYGWGWSSNVGWICLGETCIADQMHICNGQVECDPTRFGMGIPSGGWQAKIDSNTFKMSGWAKVLSLGDQGWIHLGEGSATAPSQAGEACYDCQPTCKTWTQQCGESGCVDVEPCLEYDPVNFDSCRTCFTNTQFDPLFPPKYYGSYLPGAEPALGGSGSICFTCSGNCHRVCSQATPEPDCTIFRVVCSTCSTCSNYGGAEDSTNKTLLGWAWNGNGTAEGAGWIQFNPPSGGVGIVYPWLQTQYGSVFSQNIIRQKTAVSGANASYCIFAQNAVKFRSANCTAGNLINTVDIQFPQSGDSGQTYNNVLGKLDVKGLSTTVKTLNGKNYNKYGNVIVSGVPDFNEPLNNQVYIVNNTLTASGATILNGAPGQRGNGVIIVNGDLVIMGDISYATGEISGSDLKQLASVAWIVRGDVIIDGQVQKAVGAFMILGQDDVTSPVVDLTDPDYPKYTPNHYGVFFSGASGNPLTVYGLTVAKAFDLERSYASVLQGSENFVYDGRLIANPPPGLKAFLEAMPVIRDFTY